ncbi:DNA-binding protein YbaB [Jatrophihabitans sp. GAS493]|uniref:YbaB/EbfC family nucleoid-associated protein n=1 Tax=Jatrophihabitans sp. GAS493 TaxID=1907575 RepID=UPI000BBFF860|nr:YbaB/EbfC family nucleoid-associated protein [Jatrophihabitans sp. GAS493]SOD72407.1 DNA-binding protein YbaB [Jatrophihabitans sp. GAS493]
MSSLVPRFDAERARAASMRMRYVEIRSALAKLQVKAASEDGTVTVEMGAGGAVRAVTLTQQAMQKTPEALSRLLLETINAATQQVAEKTNEVVSPFVSNAGLDLQAITSGRISTAPQQRPQNPFAEEIERASAIPKRPMGDYARNQQPRNPQPRDQPRNQPPPSQPAPNQPVPSRPGPGPLNEEDV